MKLNFKETIYVIKDDKHFVQKYIIATCISIIVLLANIIFCPNIFMQNFSGFLGSKISGAEIFTVIIISCISGILLGGYFALYTNIKINTDKDILPNWKDNFGDILKNGLNFWVGLWLFILIMIILISILFLFFYIPIMIIRILSLSNTIINTLISIINYTIFSLLISMVNILAISSYCVDLKFVSFFKIKRILLLLKENYKNLFLISLISIVIYGCPLILVGKLGYVAKILYFSLRPILAFFISILFYNTIGQFVKIAINSNTITYNYDNCYQKCLKCNKIIKYNATYCKYCGTKISDNVNCEVNDNEMS